MSIERRGGVGQLEEEDLLPVDVLDPRRVVPAGQDVEAVEAGADVRVVGFTDELPGVLVGVDVPSPGQCLVGDAHPVRSASRPQTS